MGKDKHQAGQRASKPTSPVVWRRLGVLVLVFPSWNRDKRGMPVPYHLGGSIPKGMWGEAHLTCLVFVFAHFGAAPGFK